MYTLCGGGGFPLRGPIGAKPHLLYPGARGRAELCVRPTGVCLTCGSDGRMSGTAHHTQDHQSGRVSQSVSGGPHAMPACVAV